MAIFETLSKRQRIIVCVFDKIMYLSFFYYAFNVYFCFLKQVKFKVIMIADNNMRDKTPDSKNKKVWVTPELEVLDGRKTYDGWNYGPPESEDYEDFMAS